MYKDPGRAQDRLPKWVSPLIKRSSVEITEVQYCWLSYSSVY